MARLPVKAVPRAVEQRYLGSSGAWDCGTGNQESEEREIRPAALFRSIARALHVFSGRGLAEAPRGVP